MARVKQPCPECGKEIEVRGLAAHMAGTRCANLVAAAEIWIARRDRQQHPGGHFDHLGCWWPSEAEWRECCNKPVRPSVLYRYTLSLHCRSVAHVATLAGVDVDDLRTATKVRRRIQAARLAQSGTAEERQRVAAGVFAPREVLVRLARDPDPAVREAARRNRRLPGGAA